ncbi:unnamed protein product [Ilex paraguariensis]|uniref:Cytochrome P450 n=1 Tax=Ilex paraguariensis TaxID=185542 RepID=A0ABC8UB10_9AQUA
MGKQPHVSLTNFAQTYGPIMSLRLGTQVMVVGSSPAAAVEILKTHDRVLSARYVPDMLHVKSLELNYLSMGWAHECNDGWKYLRTLCRTELFLRRICPGLPMAAKGVPFVLASLIHFFDWSLPHGNDLNELDMTEKFGITLQKEQPLLLIPKARK